MGAEKRIGRGAEKEKIKVVVDVGTVEMVAGSVERKAIVAVGVAVIIAVSVAEKVAVMVDAKTAQETAQEPQESATTAIAVEIAEIKRVNDEEAETVAAECT